MTIPDPLDIHEELQMLRGAVDAFNNVIIVTDPTVEDNPIVFANRGFELLTGYAREEVLGQNCRLLQADDREQPGIQKLREAVSQGRHACVVLHNYRKDGSMFWSELYLNPSYHNGKLSYFFGVLNDITHRKELEQNNRTLIETNERLERAILTISHDTNQFSHKVLRQLAITKVLEIDNTYNVLSELSRRERQILE